MNPHRWPSWAVPVLLFVVSALASAFTVVLHNVARR